MSLAIGFVAANKRFWNSTNSDSQSILSSTVDGSYCRPVDQLLAALCAYDYDGPDSGYLGIRNSKWIFKLYVGPANRGDEGWIYAQSADRPEDLGCTPTAFFKDVPDWYNSVRLASILPTIEQQRELTRTSWR